MTMTRNVLLLLLTLCCPTFGVLSPESDARELEPSPLVSDSQNGDDEMRRSLERELEAHFLDWNSKEHMTPPMHMKWNTGKKGGGKKGGRKKGGKKGGGGKKGHNAKWKWHHKKTHAPTPCPTPEPTPSPTPEPTPEPTYAPTSQPTDEPTAEPSAEPTPESPSGSADLMDEAPNDMTYSESLDLTSLLIQYTLSSSVIPTDQDYGELSEVTREYLDHRFKHSFPNDFDSFKVESFDWRSAKPLVVHFDVMTEFFKHSGWPLPDEDQLNEIAKKSIGETRYLAHLVSKLSSGNPFKSVLAVTILKMSEADEESFNDEGGEETLNSDVTRESSSSTGAIIAVVMSSTFGVLGMAAIFAYRRKRRGGVQDKFKDRTDETVEEQTLAGSLVCVDNNSTLAYPRRFSGDGDDGSLASSSLKGRLGISDTDEGDSNDKEVFMIESIDVHD